MCLVLWLCVMWLLIFSFFFFNDTATTEIYTLSLHDALPILHLAHQDPRRRAHGRALRSDGRGGQDVRRHQYSAHVRRRQGGGAPVRGGHRRQADLAEERRARRPELCPRRPGLGGGGPAGEDAHYPRLRLHRQIRVISRRRLLHGATAMAAAAAWPRPALAQVTDAGRAAMAGAATAFLGALPDAARSRAVIAFGDKERVNWHYVPRGREGLPFKSMPASARAAAHELMKASLSAVGYAKAVNVIRLETVLRQLETFGGLMRDPENYSVTVFGSPDAPGAPWGWRLEGHHLSLNFTLVPGKPVAVTPAFFGANPAEVRSGPLKGLRTLAGEQDLGRALAQSMDAGQRRRMIISAQSLGDIVSGPGREESLASQAGLPTVDLAPAQRELLVQLVEEYARNMRPDVAEEHLRRIREAGIERLYFAWAGPIDPGHAHYYRIHGPSVLIEFDNSQNDANHIHSVWHDPRNV